MSDACFPVPSATQLTRPGYWNPAFSGCEGQRIENRRMALPKGYVAPRPLIVLRRNAAGDGRAEPAAHYSMARGFIRLLVDVIDFGAVEAGAPIVKTLKRLPEPTRSPRRSFGSPGPCRRQDRAFPRLAL